MSYYRLKGLGVDPYQPTGGTWLDGEQKKPSGMTTGGTWFDGKQEKSSGMSSWFDKPPKDPNWYGQSGPELRKTPMVFYIERMRSKAKPFDINSPYLQYPDPNDTDRTFACRQVPPGAYYPKTKVLDTTFPISLEWLFKDPSVAAWCKDWNIATTRLVGETPGASAQLLKKAAEKFGSWEFDKRHFDWVKAQIALTKLWNKSGASTEAPSKDVIKRKKSPSEPVIKRKK